MSCSLTQTRIKLTVFVFQNNAAGGFWHLGNGMEGARAKHCRNCVRIFLFVKHNYGFNPTMCPEAKTPTCVEVLLPGLQSTSPFWLKPDTLQCFCQMGNCLRIKIIK